MAVGELGALLHLIVEFQCHAELAAHQQPVDAMIPRHDDLHFLARNPAKRKRPLEVVLAEDLTDVVCVLQGISQIDQLFLDRPLELRAHGLTKARLAILVDHFAAHVDFCTSFEFGGCWLVFVV